MALSIGGLPSNEAGERARVHRLLRSVGAEVDQVDKVGNQVIFTGYFGGQDGLPVRFRWYEHLGPDEMVVAFLQGQAEFIEKYDFLFSRRKEVPEGRLAIERTMRGLGATFVTLDYPGHGGSQEGRTPSHVDSYTDYTDEVFTLLELVKKSKGPDVPVILASHSTGGLVSVRFAQQYPDLVDGMVFSAPFWGYALGEGETPEERIAYYDYYSVDLGLPRLCVAPEQVDGETIGALPQCARGELGEACAECISSPETCTDPEGLAYLEAIGTLRSVGDLGCSPTPFSCPLPRNIDDVEFCEYIRTHPLQGVPPTFGWLSASFRAQEDFFSGPPIKADALIVSTVNDIIVDPTVQTCEKFEGQCRLVSLDTPSHALFIGSSQERVLAETRAFLRSFRRLGDPAE